MDFKQWRIENGLTVSRAAAIFGHTASYFQALENRKSTPAKSAAAAKVLSLYGDKIAWGKLNKRAGSLTAADVSMLISYWRKKGWTFARINRTCGFSSNSVMGRYGSGQLSLKRARYSNKLILAYFVIRAENKIDPVVAETQIEIPNLMAIPAPAVQVQKIKDHSPAPAGPDKFDLMFLLVQEAKLAQEERADLKTRLDLLDKTAPTLKQLTELSETAAETAHEKHKSELYFLNKHVKNAATENTMKVHGKSNDDNYELWEAYQVLKITEINTMIKTAVSENYECKIRDTPGRDRYNKFDKLTAYKALNKWRLLNGLRSQPSIDLMD